MQLNQLKRNQITSYTILIEGSLNNLQTLKGEQYE